MLDEYILNQLEKISHQKVELGKQLRAISDEENSENLKITQLMDVDDLGKEIFSPRGTGEPLKLKISAIRKHIEELLLQEARLRDQMEKLTAEEDKYREMLAEARNEGDNPNEDLIDDEVRNHSRVLRNREELEIVLKKLEHCISISKTDPAGCTEELTNQRYYVMALISST